MSAEDNASRGSEDHQNWDEDEDFDSDGEWGIENSASNSPSVWDPKDLQEQTGDIQGWERKDRRPKKIQDIASPILTETTGVLPTSDQEEWPFESPCSFEEKIRRTKSSSRVVRNVGSNHTGSDGEIAQGRGKASSSVGLENVGDSIEAWQMRESWKSSAHTSSTSNSSEVGEPHAPRIKTSRSKKDKKPKKPKRSLSSRSDSATHSSHEATRKPSSTSRTTSAKGRKSDKGRQVLNAAVADDGGLTSDVEPHDNTAMPNPELKARKKSAGNGESQRGGCDGSDNFYEEIIAIEQVERGCDVDGPSRNASDSVGEKERGGSIDRSVRVKSGKLSVANDESEMYAERVTLSGGRRSKRRQSLNKAQSERWMNSVEGELDKETESIQRRARASLQQASVELSRSAHSGRRGSGSRRLNGRGLALGTASYHEMTARRRSRSRSESNDSLDSDSFHDDSNERSGRSQRTLDSIEDLEDFGHIDFQTPGMVDYDDEIWELMQRANPENTAQLNRRVHRQRDRLTYDQNMPLMTRQALMTRQGSALMTRQSVDASNVDKNRLLLRSDSISSASTNEELSKSQHRARLLSTQGTRRAPPRSRSSGLAGLSATEVPGFMRQSQRQDDGPDRRQLFRTRSTNTSSFRQYQNKPNKVAQLSRRTPGPGDAIERHSMRGTAGGNLAAAKDRRRSLQRAKSTTSLRRPLTGESPGTESSTTGSIKASPEKITSRTEEVPRNEAVYDDRSGSAVVTEDDDIDSESEPNEMRKRVGSTVVSSSPVRKRPASKMIVRKPPARTKSVPVRPTPLLSPIRKVVKHDMMNRNHRERLHAILFERKMGVKMRDLSRAVKKGEKVSMEFPLMITAP